MKRLFAAMTAALLMAALVSSTVVAKAPTEQWRVYNVKPATSSYWDINKLASNGTFPIQEFSTILPPGTTGSFAVYVLNNYNVDITGKTLSASLAWTPGAYLTRGVAGTGAYVRFEFQDVTAGPYDSNDYWWSSSIYSPAIVGTSLDLNNGSSGGTLTASLTDCTLWSNQSGKSACDTTKDWVQWQGNIVHMSPADGFAKAAKNVKQLGLSFGNTFSYASGVAIYGQTGTFTMSSFTVTP